MTSAPLARRLGVTDAVVVGASSMIGAGVFVVFAPAATAAGPWMLVGLALAAVVALCNATSSAQLAATFPTSGGTYVYGREQLGPWWGYAAGWCFVVGKSASCAAMATTVAVYTVPAAWQRPVAAGVVVALTAVSWRGITRTAALARAVLVFVLAVLLLAVAASWLGAAGGGPAGPAGDGGPVGPADVLRSAGLIFFALAGYARIATLGEEVRDPVRTIPRAIVTALAGVTALYVVVAVTALAALGPDRLAVAAAPLAAAAATGPWPWVPAVVGIGAAAASLGALLALLTGVSRTVLAMARTGDLPRPLAGVHPRFAVPHRAEAAVATVVVVAVLLVDLRELIGFSSFGVLLYYAVANLAALTQHGERRRYPRAMQVAGVVGCLVLAVSLPGASVLAGAAVLAVGLVYRLVRVGGQAPAPPTLHE